MEDRSAVSAEAERSSPSPCRPDIRQGPGPRRDENRQRARDPAHVLRAAFFLIPLDTIKTQMHIHRTGQADRTEVTLGNSIQPGKRVGTAGESYRNDAEQSSQILPRTSCGSDDLKFKDRGNEPTLCPTGPWLSLGGDTGSLPGGWSGVTCPLSIHRGEMHQATHCRSEYLVHFVAVISQPQGESVQSLKQTKKTNKNG